MKKIGEGYYYNVYDLNNGRVLKKQKGKFKIFLFIFFENKLNIKNTIKEFKNVINSIPRLRGLYLSIFSTGIDVNLLGNPTLLSGIDYEQDKVSVIKDITSNEDFVVLVNKYTDLVKKLWEFGINESVYNFTFNNGYNENGQILLIDFNEVTFNIGDVVGDVQNKVWLKRASFKSLDGKKKIIFEDLMNKEITVKNLKSIWCTSRMETVH